jgi:hypothetical protein
MNLIKAPRYIKPNTSSIREDFDTSNDFPTGKQKYNKIESKKNLFEYGTEENCPNPSNQNQL